MLGPSQQYGWVGHGSYAPVNIPNIFKAAGIKTRWTPGIDPVFQVGLLYPGSNNQVSQPQNNYAPAPVNYESSVKVKKSIPNSLYKKETASKPAEAPQYQEPTATAPAYQEQPAVPPVYKEQPATPPSYVETPAVAPVHQELPAIPPAYTGPKTFIQSSIGTSQQIHTSTSRPFVNLRGSPSPPPDYVVPTTFKPAFVSSTSRPFSLVVSTTTTKPKITTTSSPAKKNQEDVFYIFYENDEKPLVSSKAPYFY